MKPLFVPPDIGTIVIGIILLFAAIARLHTYRRTKNPQNVSEAIARICLAMFYFLIAYASTSNFGKYFTPEHWRIYSRYAISGLFLIEVVPWFVGLLRNNKGTGKKQR